MNIRNRIVAVLACAAGLFGAASAEVISVPSDSKTISEAMVTARMGDTVKVAPGVYRENVIMAPGVILISTSLFEAKIDGGGRGTAVTMSKTCIIEGFEVRNGTVGIFSSDMGNEINSCRIVNNWMTGIIAVRHLPKIQDNIIAFNRASGIQGWDVRSTAATVNHNSIAYNGNHGIAVGGSSEFIIENNVIAFNEKFGLKVLQEPEKIQVSSNNFWRNLYQPGKPLPDNNFAFDPAFIAPRSGMNFKPDPGQCCKSKGSDDENLGARLNY
ncbi:MAG: right-handed parallel beta-helix repeat-containing protein [Chitinispirillales bacterium]|jgi:parallel beta-helix repeat protein|nr:right-handed parallel beta-helix repeat-containing protein [Chitinispirillales bacterium]